MGKVILVSSGKGGTGKTMFVANMGAYLARKGYRVMLIDMDMALRNLDLYLGMEDRVVYNIMDVMSGVCRISKATIKVDGFDTLYFMAASPRKDERDITPLHMDVLCNKLRDIFDYIIIDGPAGIGEMTDVAAAPADEVVLVTEPDNAALRDADVTERYLMENGIKKTCIVINKINVELMHQGVMPNLVPLMKMFKGSLVGIIQEDDNIRVSTSHGIPIVCKEDTYIEKNFSDIVARILK